MNARIRVAALMPLVTALVIAPLACRPKQSPVSPASQPAGDLIAPPRSGEEVLGPFTPTDRGSCVGSREGQHLAWVAERGQKKQVYLDGRPVGTAQETAWGLTLSPEGEHVAFMIRSDNRWKILRDGRPGALHDDIKQVTVEMLFSGGNHKLECTPEKRPGTPVALFSPDGRRMAYAAQEAGKWRVWIDDQPGPEFDGIGTEMNLGMVFSPDSKHFAYVARKGDKWLVVVDGQQGPEFGGVGLSAYGGPVFSSDSRHLAYLGGRDKQCFVVLDGHVSPPYESVLVSRLSSLPVLFSPDGTRNAYFAKAAGKWRVVVDGKAGDKTYDMVPEELAFSADGRRLACDAEVRDLDGPTGPERITGMDAQRPPAEFFHCLDLAFSPDGSRFAHVAGPGGARCVVVDGNTGPPYQSISSWSLKFSPDSKRFAYGAQILKPGYMKYVMVVDGKAGPGYDSMGEICFSPDSKHSAYRAAIYGLPSREFLVVDGQEELQSQPVLWARFTSDSNHLVALTWDSTLSKDGKQWMVVDGRAGPKYDFIVCPSTSGKIADSYLAVRDKTLYRVALAGLDQPAPWPTAASGPATRPGVTGKP